MKTFNQHKKPLSLASKIMIGMLTGLIVGLLIKFLPQSSFVNTYIVDGLFEVGGKLFIAIMKMLVVPIVFVSLVCGTCSIGSAEKLGRLGLKTLLLFILTTVIAISIGLFFANLFNVGCESHLILRHGFHVTPPLSLKETFINLIPSNPISAMAEGNLLQIIIFAIFIGVAISMAGKSGKMISQAFEAFNVVLMKLINIIMLFAPYGVFFLIAKVFAQIGISLIGDLLLYMLTAILVLAIQLFGTYSACIIGLGKLNPIPFFKKMYPAMLFAFGTSSSNASIPLVLETSQKKLGVDKSIGSFIVPLGATINMDGTAIMQGIAAVFIAHIYHITLGPSTYLTIIITATLASIGTAGVPGVGIITLAMVLQQAGLPLDGIGLIIGVDRLIDMLRTVINVSGDVMTSIVVGKSEKAFDRTIYLE